MTFKEFHILNENISDFTQKIEEFLDGKDINNFFKYNEENKIVFADNISKEDKDEIYKIMEDTGYKSTYEGRNKNTFSQKSLGKSIKKLTKGNSKPEENVTNTKNISDSNTEAEQEDEAVEKNVAQEIDDFLNKQNYTPNINSVPYSKLQINSSSFKTFDALKILYSAINTFKIKKEWVKGENSQILYIIEALSKAAGNDKKLSQDEYANALIGLSERFDLAREPNILKFILFLTKLKTANVQLPSNSVYYVGSSDLKADFDKNSPVNVDKKQEEKNLAYIFFNYAHNKPAPKDNEYGSTLRNLANFVRNITFELDDILDNKTKTVFDINNFVKEENKEVENKEPEKEGLRSRTRSQYLSKRITDNKRNLDRYDRETEKLKDNDSYSKLSDDSQIGKTADKDTYGFNIDIPTADQESIENFKKRITHLFQKELLNITGALRIKGIAGEDSEANEKNNAISRTWQEAIKRSCNKTINEGFLNKINPLRGLRDNKLADKIPDENGEYTSKAENRAKKIFDEYLSKGTELINTYVRKMENASRKVETGKTYAQRVNKEWGITKAYYDLLRELFDLKLACKKECEEGGLTKAINKVKKIKENFIGDKEYREKNAISNADAVKKMLEKQIVNIKGPNDLQVIARLSLFDVLFNSKSAEEAINKINNGDFNGIGLNNVKDFSGQAKRGSSLNLSNPSSVYNKPAQLFKAIGVNAAEITEDGLTQLQKSLDKEECLTQINKFKNIVEKVMEKITPKTSISLEDLFLKNGFLLKEDAQALAAAEDNAKKAFAKGIDLTDIVSMLDDSSWIPFRQAIGGNVLVTGKKDGKETNLLFTKDEFKAAQIAQAKYGEEKAKDEKEKQQSQPQQNNIQQPQQSNQQTNNSQQKDAALNPEDQAQYASSSVVTTNAVDSTYGNGYQKQTPQNRMKEIIYKKGNYTVKTKQMI